MSIFTDTQVNNLRRERTPWRGEECYITFYKESDYKALSNKTNARAQMVPVGDYLFVQGVTITHNMVEHPAVQALNSSWKNLSAPSYIESSLSVNNFYVQEGDSMEWLYNSTSSSLLAFIDFIDSEKTKKSKDDSLDGNLNMVQTIVIRALRCTNRTITSNMGGIVNYQLSFTGGEVITLPLGSMDLP